MNPEYQSLHGTQVRFSSQDEEMRAEYVLQRHREVWVVTSTHPYLAIDENALREKMASVDSFTMFSAGYLFQNLRPRDLSARMVANFFGPGIVASTSPTSDMLVDGEANPQAYLLSRGNGLLQLGTHPFAAIGTHYIAVEPGKIFQRKIGELETVDDGRRTQPRSTGFDFDKLGHLTQKFHVARSPSSTHDPLLHARILDEIFEQNLLALSFADAHHASEPRIGPKYNYKAGELTRYGRLVHTEQGEPRIETSFALLHYEKALYEFDALKRSTMAQDPERQYMHGVYCVVAIASCLEAVANRLSFEADGQHPSGNQPSHALSRLNSAARKLALASGRTFNSLGSKYPEYMSMDQVRVLRNSFVHANEVGVPVDPTMLTSAQKAQVSETACRNFLENLRLTVTLVFDQLPWVLRPLMTDTNRKWLGDIEVP